MTGLLQCQIFSSDTKIPPLCGWGRKLQELELKNQMTTTLNMYRIGYLHCLGQVTCASATSYLLISY